MEADLIIYKCIMVLYWSASLPNPSSATNLLIKNVLSRLTVDAGFGEDDRTRAIDQMKTTANWMADQPAGCAYDIAELMVRIRINTAGNADLLSVYTDSFEADYAEDVRARFVADYITDLRSHLQRERLVAMIDRRSRNYKFNPETIDWAKEAKELQEALEPLVVVADAGVKDPALMDEVRTSRPETFVDAIQRGLDDLSPDGILTCGWQGVNRMTGTFNGFRRGEMITTPGLQHNYKTGLTLELTRQIAMHNTPYMWDPSKKPLIIHLSTENSVKDNILEMYCVMHVQETGEPVDLVTLSKRVADDPELLNDITNYVITNLQRTGYEMVFLRVNPTQFTFSRLVEYINKYESEGYEIHLLTIDYLNMFNKSDLSTSGAIGDDSMVLYRSVRNLCAPKGITVITPHQISAAGKKINRDGVTNFAKEATTKNLYAGSSSIDQEVDLEIFVHLERRGDDTYVTLARGKHRKSGPQTPMKDRFTVYKFHPTMGLPEDINGKDMSRREVDEPGQHEMDIVPLDSFFG